MPESVVERRCHHGQLTSPCPLCLEEEGHAIRDYARAMAFKAEIAMNKRPSVLPDCMMPDGAEPCKAYQQQTARANRWERRAQALERIALKAFTVVEWVVGEGKLLSDPHFDADDLLLEMGWDLGVEDSRDACARLSKPFFTLPPSCRCCGTDYGWSDNRWLARCTCQPAA